MPPESLVKVVKTNKDFSPGEMFYQKKDQIREDVRHIRLKESPHAAQRAVGKHQRIDTPILKITPRIDQRIDGESQFRLQQDPTRNEIISVKYYSLPMSEEMKHIIVEQGFIEAFEFMELTSKMRCN